MGVDELDGDAGRLVEDILQLPMLLMLLMLSIAFETLFLTGYHPMVPSIDGELRAPCRPPEAVPTPP